jgi:hypothetical protein
LGLSASRVWELPSLPASLTFRVEDDEDDEGGGVGYAEADIGSSRPSCDRFWDGGSKECCKSVPSCSPGELGAVGKAPPARPRPSLDVDCSMVCAEWTGKGDDLIAGNL